MELFQFTRVRDTVTWRHSSSTALEWAYDFRIVMLACYNCRDSNTCDYLCDSMGL